MILGGAQLHHGNLLSNPNKNVQIRSEKEIGKRYFRWSCHTGLILSSEPDADQVHWLDLSILEVYHKYNE